MQWPDLQVGQQLKQRCGEERGRSSPTSGQERDATGSWAQSAKHSLRRVEVELLRTQGTHDGVEDTKLKRGERSDHHAARAQALGAKLHDARLLRDVHHALRDGAIATSDDAG